MKSFIVRLAGALGLIVAIAGPVMAPVASADIKISSSTAFTTIAGTHFNNSYGMAADATNLWVSSSGGGDDGFGFVTYCNMDGTTVCTDLQGSSFNLPKGLAIINGTVFVVNQGNNTITMINAATKAVTGVITDNHLHSPIGALAEKGNLFVANSEGSVAVFSATGTFIAETSSPQVKVYDYGSENQMISGDGTHLWVVSDASAAPCNGSCVVELNESTLAVVGSYEAAGGMPFASADNVYSDGTYVWNADDGNDTYIFRYTIATGATIKIPVTDAGYGEDFYGFAHNGNQLLLDAASWHCAAFSTQNCISFINYDTATAGGAGSTAIAAALPVEATQQYLWARGCLWGTNGSSDGSKSTLIRLCNAITPAATISAVTPGEGPVAGGTTLHITGSHFQSDSVVTVNGQACQHLTIVSPTAITCVTPSNLQPEAVTVSVTNPDTPPATAPYQYLASLPKTGGSPEGLILAGLVLVMTGAFLATRRRTHA